MTDAGVLARLERIEQKLDRILVLLTPTMLVVGTAEMTNPGGQVEPGSVSGGLRDHEGQDAR